MLSACDDDDKTPDYPDCLQNTIDNYIINYQILVIRKLFFCFIPNRQEKRWFTELLAAYNKLFKNMGINSATIINSLICIWLIVALSDFAMVLVSIQREYYSSVRM